MRKSSNENFSDNKTIKESSKENLTEKSNGSHEKIFYDSLNITENQLDELKKIIPHVFNEGKIDFEKLKLSLGEKLGYKEEMYSFNWAGRKKAYKHIQTTAKSTLKPNKNESINFDSTENIFIDGDNLEVLKLLQKTYFNKIKMIYIDPPYNTGKDFIYKDDYIDSVESYLKQIGQISDKGIKLTTNLNTNGRFHSDWITMMYPRLFIARSLLKEDGVIFVSIDDNEVHNLRMIMDEIFDEDNFIGQFAWRKKVGAGADSKLFFRQHEYLLLYAKNKSNIKALYQPLNEKQKKEYSNPDNDSRGPWAPTDLSSPAHDNDPKRIYEVKSPTGKVFTKCWSYTEDNFYKLIKDDLIWWGSNGNSMPKRKRFLKDKKGLTPRSWIDFFLTSDGRKDLKEINMDNYFDYPKPKGLMKHIITIATGNDDIILDYFAGSGTIGHAILELNMNENSNRKFIMIQLNELINEKTEAYKAGYVTISDIAKDRIKRVITKLKKEKNDKLIKNEVDLGFKSFKWTNSNFRIWEDYKGTDKKDLLEQMKFFESPLVDGYKDIDVIYECIIKEGYDLNSKIEKTDFKSNIIYKVTDGELSFYTCLDIDIKEETIDKLNLNKDDLFIALDTALDDTKKSNLVTQCNLKTI